MQVHRATKLGGDRTMVVREKTLKSTGTRRKYNALFDLALLQLYMNVHARFVMLLRLLDPTNFDPRIIILGLLTTTATVQRPCQKGLAVNVMIVLWAETRKTFVHFDE